MIGQTEKELDLKTNKNLTSSITAMELQIIQQKIFEIRGQKIMLDFDSAELYQVETKRHKEAVRRNMERFPSDFIFQLTKDEFKFLRTQIATSNQRGGIRYLPFAFTEQGVAMLSSVLNSQKSINVNIAIMRAFVYIRQYALSHKDLTEQLKKLEEKYNKQFIDIYEAINYLLQKDKKEIDKKIEENNWKNRKRIGFKNE